MKAICFILLILVLVPVTADSIFARIINVPDDFETIQAGIDAAEDGDTVLVQPGEYVENIDFEGRLITVGSLILTTNNPAYNDSTFIDGDENGSVVVFDNAETEAAILTGFTIRNGYSESGGGIHCSNSRPTLTYLLIVNNQAELNGGGIFLDYRSAPPISFVTVRENQAENNGGGIFANQSQLLLTNVVVINNMSLSGGGIFTELSEATLLSVDVNGNEATQLAGGIRCLRSEMHYENGSVAYNVSYGEGGISGGFSSIRLIRVLINRNQVDAYAGGLYSGDSEMTLFNVTVSNNISRQGGGAFTRARGKLDIINSIFWNNEPQEIWLQESQDSVSINYSDIDGGREGIVIHNDGHLFWGDGNLNANPLFTDPENDDYHLTEDSPCIDVGDPDSPEDPDSTRADMGAFYFHQLGSLVNVPDDFETIQAAIDDEGTQDGDTVLVAPGTYGRIDFLGKDIVVASLFLTTEDEAYIDSTVIDGDSSWTVVTFENGESENAQLIGLTLTNGITDENGGGILCIDSSPTVRSCRIVGNSAEVSGGGLYVNGECTPVFERCEICNNVSWQTGGGISISRQAASIFINCLMTGNVTQEDGHTAACSDGSSVTFSNCTIAQNGVPWEHPHGSIFCAGAEVILVNTISFENFIAEVRFDPWGEASRAIISHSNIDVVSTNDNGEVHWLDGNIDTDPLFANPENGDFHLTEDSPCINAGIALFVWEGDTLIDLSPDEYIGEAPDIGAYESQYGAGVKSDNPNIPMTFYLQSIYPNPFNPSVTVRFSLDRGGMTRLAVFDVSGREMDTLLNDQLKPGSHRVTWNGEQFAAGVYFFRLELGDRLQVRKGLLIR